MVTRSMSGYNWLGEPLTQTFSLPNTFHSQLSTRVSAWLVDGVWTIPANIQTTLPNLMLLISKKVPQTVGTEDMLVWTNTADGNLSTKTTYDFIMKPNVSDSWSYFP